MHCKCNRSSYCYEPAGHVVTGDLNIICDSTLRLLIKKGPSCREQNYVNWKVNENKLRRCAVAEFKRKWSFKERVDTKACNEWESKLNQFIKRRIRFLRGEYNRRKQHVLQSRKHLNYLQELHSFGTSRKGSK